ncbi:MAG: hypothetical protein R3C61_18960 [Bacteroidia bacterium]
MVSQTTGTIHLAGRRARAMKTNYLSYQIFRTDALTPWKSFCRLISFNDEVLSGGGQIRVQTYPGEYSLLMPVAGEMVVTAGEYNDRVEPGEMLIIPPGEISNFFVSSPSHSNPVNYLSFRIKTTVPVTAPTPVKQNFDLTLTHPSGCLLWEIPGVKVSMVKLGGRQDGEYRPKEKGVFVFVMAGVWEVQNRLLQDRDGLSLKYPGTVEYESLSPEGILLMIETAE